MKKDFNYKLNNLESRLKILYYYFKTSFVIDFLFDIETNFRELVIIDIVENCINQFISKPKKLGPEQYLTGKFITCKSWPGKESST